MTITREQVADLQPGDVVEYSGHRELHGAKIVGPLHVGPTGSLCVGDYVVRSQSGAPGWSKSTVTVVSRAPRPLYVNHPRGEPVPGDVVRDADDDTPLDVWVRTWGALPDRWAFANGGAIYDDAEMPKSLRLLVDGETGMTVPQ